MDFTVDAESFRGMVGTGISLEYSRDWRVGV